MGYHALETTDASQRELPQVDFAGTLFYVDIKNHEFRQVDNPYNRITLGNVSEQGMFTHFLYDTETKNRYTGNGNNVPDYVRIVLVPPLSDLDPVGLAKRQGLPLNPEWKQRERLNHIAAEQYGTPKKRKGKRL